MHSARASKAPLRLQAVTICGFNHQAGYALAVRLTRTATALLEGSAQSIRAQSGVELAYIPPITASSRPDLHRARNFWLIGRWALGVRRTGRWSRMRSNFVQGSGALRGRGEHASIAEKS